MATHSSILAWKTPWTEEPGRLQSTGVSKTQTRLSDFTHSLTMHCEHVKPTFSWYQVIHPWSFSYLSSQGMGAGGVHSGLSDLHAQAILSKLQHINLLCVGVQDMSPQG